jgi:VanZ family protein
LILLAYGVILSLGTHWPTLGIQGTPRREGAGVLLPDVDKLVHIGAFGTLTVLVILAWPAPRPGQSPGLLWPSGAALLWASLSEATQPLTGRTFSLGDLFYNALGVLIVAMLWWSWRWARPTSDADSAPR